MNKIVNFGLIYKNKIGIVSKITEVLHKNDCNILQSNMVRIGNHFAFDITSTMPVDRELNNIIDKNLIDTNNIKIQKRNINVTKMRIYCSDNPGIIFETSHELEKNNCDIIKIKSYTIPAPITSIPLFNMHIEYNNHDNNENIKLLIKNRLEKYNCDIDYII